MTTARERLLGFVNDPKYHEVPRSELEPLWLAAANEQLALQRERIPVLSRWRRSKVSRRSGASTI